MRIIWELEPCTVADIRSYIQKEMGGAKPPHSTISTLVSHLNRKGFLHYEAYGRTYVYSAAVSKSIYSKKSIKQLAKDFFDGSLQSMVSFLVKEESLSPEELRALREQLDESEKDSTS